MNDADIETTMRVTVLATVLSLVKLAKDLGPEWECVVEYCKKVVDETIPEEKP